MKRMLMAVLAVAVMVAFTAPSFAGEEKKEKKDKKEGTKVIQMLGAEEKKKDEKKKDEKKK
jgi:hypothetical protein